MNKEELEKLGDLIADLTDNDLLKLNEYVSYFYDFIINIDRVYNESNT